VGAHGSTTLTQTAMSPGAVAARPSSPKYSGPTIQAAPPWYASAWSTLVGRLASDQPLIKDPRGSTTLQTSRGTYNVPNYVHEDPAFWIAGNLYHRPLVGDLIGAVEAPFRLLANPLRYTNAAASGVVNTVANVPKLPEIWQAMPDYQRQDMAVRMLATPYLKVAGAGMSGVRAAGQDVTAARFHGEPFAFGNGSRLQRVESIVREAARVSRVDMGSLVDDVVYDPKGSYFTVTSGRRVLSLGDSAFGRTGSGQLMEAAHEIVHAQQFQRFAARQFAGQSVDDAAAAFFSVSDRVYARQERVAEYLARLRVHKEGGGVTPQQWGASTKYIEGWRPR